MENFASLFDNHMYKLRRSLNETDIILDNLGESSSGSNDSGSSAALVLAAFSFALWCAAMLYLLWRAVHNVSKASLNASDGLGHTWWQNYKRIDLGGEIEAP